MEKAIIVAVNSNRIQSEFDEEILELKNLCLACDIEVIEVITQNLDYVNRDTYVGKGKLDEVKASLDSNEIELIIANDELSPAQVVNMENSLEVDIFDRTYIILEIFKQRAKTKEAMLQVDLATKKYLLPRLIGSRKGLSRQRGTGGGFARGRGVGEMKIELERRDIYDEISDIKKELQELVKLRKQQRIKRQKNQMKVVSLVGYTNSGKSSTLNSFLNYSVALKKEVFEKDMLFATLETSTRLIKTPRNLQFLLTDTVGFVSKLPHQLVEAFKSTLEEIVESDLIIHIVDSSNPNFEKQIEVTNHVLKEIGVKDIPIIYAFNKIDLHENYFYIPASYSDAIRISARTGRNIELLISKIEDELFKSYHNVILNIPFEKANLVNLVKEGGIVEKIETNDFGYSIEAKISDYLYEVVRDYIKA
jgi:GTP-binding protein HflX